MLGTFEDYLTRQRQKWVNFDESDLAKKFIPAYNDNQRIRVKFSYGEVKTGTVGVTTGWKPQFLLLLRKDSISSSYTLSKDDNFTNEKVTKYGR